MTGRKISQEKNILIQFPPRLMLLGGQPVDPIHLQKKTNEEGSSGNITEPER